MLWLLIGLLVCGQGDDVYNPVALMIGDLIQARTGDDLNGGHQGLVPSSVDQGVLDQGDLSVPRTGLGSFAQSDAPQIQANLDMLPSNTQTVHDPAMEKLLKEPADQVAQGRNLEPEANAQALDAKANELRFAESRKTEAINNGNVMDNENIEFKGSSEQETGNAASGEAKIHTVASIGNSISNGDSAVSKVESTTALTGSTTALAGSAVSKAVAAFSEDLSMSDIGSSLMEGCSGPNNCDLPTAASPMKCGTGPSCQMEEICSPQGTCEKPLSPVLPCHPSEPHCDTQVPVPKTIDVACAIGPCGGEVERPSALHVSLVRDNNGCVKEPCQNSGDQDMNSVADLPPQNRSQFFSNVEYVDSPSSAARKALLSKKFPSLPAASPKRELRAFNPNVVEAETVGDVSDGAHGILGRLQPQLPSLPSNAGSEANCDGQMINFRCVSIEKDNGMLKVTEFSGSASQIPVPV